MKQTLKRYLLIYLCAVLGIVTVIGLSFLLGDIANRLKPDNQILLEGENETDEDGEALIKIYAWENVWDDELTLQTVQLAEMKSGEAIRVGAPMEAENITGSDDVAYKGYKSVYRYYGAGDDSDRVNQLNIRAYFVIEADGEIELVYSSATISGNYRLRAGAPERGYLTLSELSYSELPRGRYSLMVGVDARYHEVDKASADQEDFSKRHIITGCGGSVHSRSYTEALPDVYANITAPDYRRISRNVFESALLISVYDRTKPEKLLAQAELRFVNYTAWQYNGENVPELLAGLGLDTPDSYGYSEAVLYDYWQAEEW